MHRCAIDFIARHWWRRLEIWLIAVLLIAGCLMLGFQAGQWSASAEHTRQ
ncbi:lipoprotein, partial [Pseudomonas syringae pv. actinidiae ICMP 18804]